MILVNNMNFIAGGSINAHDLLTIDTSNSTAQKLCVKQAGSADCVVGVATCAASAGDVVQMVKLEIGQVVPVVASAAITAGAQLGASSGKVAGSGALPLFAIDAASASGDVIRAVCAIHPDANT